MGSTALDACLHAALLKGHAEQGRQSVADDRNDDLDHKDTITILTRVLHLHHAETVRHACRVAEIAHAIAIKMGLDPAHAESVRTAGLLHDIGKIMVSREGILDSRAPLTETDWQCIKEHPQAGYDVLSTVEWPSPIPDIVFQHHERMDGTGYPAGRRGDAILLEARILAVADALDARAHRQDQTAECGIAVALAHLRDNSGTLYDAAVVKTCCEIFEDPAASPSAPRADSGARPCTTVLVIDDEPAMGRSIERSLLGLNGVVVSVAADGASGLDIARRTTPGMILLDIRMPGMDGMDVLRELQTEPETESIPVVMLTAVDDRETMRAALVAGVEDYLTKPVPPDWLREVVARRLSPQQHR